MKQRIFNLGLLLFVGLFGYNFSLAQEGMFSNGKNMEIIATVNIYEAMVVSQDKNDFKISFKLTNREKAQPDVRYAVQLLKEKDGVYNEIVDQKIYNEVVNLGENDSVQKNINYNAPKWVSGEYALAIVSRNEKGLPLAFSPIGKKVILSGDGNYVEILGGSCLMRVDGKDYASGSGVDVATTEKLEMVCSVKNNSDVDMSVFANLQTHERTVFGKIISEEKLNGEYELSPKQETEIVLPVSIQRNPQAYEVVISFQNANKETVSNEGLGHYVVQGESGTINNITLDKDYYTKEETAKVSLLVSGSADSFPQARNRAERSEDGRTIALKLSSEGEVCAEEKAPLVKSDASGLSDFNLAVKSDCFNPTLKVTLLSSEGKTLDEKTVSMISKNAKNPNENKITAPSKEGLSLLDKLAIALVILIPVVLIVWVVRRKNIIVVLGLMFLVGSFGISNSARADTFFMGYDDPIDGFVGLSGVVSPSKTEYAVGEDVFLNFSNLMLTACSNLLESAWVMGKLDEEPRFTIGGVEYSDYFYEDAPDTTSPPPALQPIAKINPPFQMVGPYTAGAGIKSDATGSTDFIIENFIGSVSLNLGSFGTVGSQDIGTAVLMASRVFDFHGSWTEYYMGSGTFMVNVVAASVDGVCGTKSKNYTDSSTVTDWDADSWCVAGTADFPNGNITFPSIGDVTSKWSCLGSGAGASDLNCQASRSLPLPTVNLKINGSSGAIAINKNTTNNVDLSWETENATSCTADGTDWTKAITDLPNGTENVPVNGTETSYTYKLECSNITGTSFDTVTANISCSPTSTVWNACPVTCGGVPNNQTGIHLDSDCNYVTDYKSCNQEPCVSHPTWIDVTP